MAKKQKPENSKGSKAKPNPAPKNVDINVGGNVGGSIVIGDHNYIVNNYYQIIEKNIAKHEPDYWALKHPYPMPPNFTGRIAERATLTHWLKEDSENRLFILRALGGFGKSALSWHWLTHDVDIKEYPKVVFWSFYEGDASFEHFIEETLQYLKLEVPQGQRPQVDKLLKAMQSQKILLIMDGFERTMRAYSSMNAAYQGDEEPKLEDNQLDCVNINAEIFLKGVCSLPNIKSKVLMTTRLIPRCVKPRGESLQGCREEKLEAMEKEDAVEFFRKQKIKGTHAEIEAACALYGYHPLSLRLLAGRILKDFENPANIVVAQKFKIDGDIIQQKHHVLEVSYNSLPPHEQKLLNTIACFRSPVELDTLMAISKQAKQEKPNGLSGLFKKKTSSEYTENINSDLEDLVERGLLHFDEKNKKFDLHPIVRRYAYEHLTSPDRIAAHARLSDHFVAIDVPAKPQTLDELAPAIELYHHMARAGKLDKAREFFRDYLSKPLNYQMNAHQIIIELLGVLFINGEDKPPYLKEKSAQAWTMGALANSYDLHGQPHRAISLIIKDIALREKANDRESLAVDLEDLALTQIKVGGIQEAERNLRRSINLAKEVENEFDEAVYHQSLASILSYSGRWQEVEQELELSFGYNTKQKDYQGLSVDWSHRALQFLLIAREDMQSKVKNLELAISSAHNAIELAEETSKARYPHPRDYIHAYWLLGASHCAHGDLILAEENLLKAISMCRQINLVADEANILLDLARLRYDQKNYEEAKSLAEEALTITERCGYVLQGADVNLFLAQYALEQEKDKVKAKEYAETALKLATCDGPPYYYKVAYEEAERFLENLK